MSKSISVIIPSFNSATWLPSAIESCLKQSEYLKEIIIADDFSTDESWEILMRYRKKYPDLIKVTCNGDKGGNNARNYAFELSTGDFIQWLDADDRIEEAKFKNQVRVFELDQSIDIVYSDWQLDTYRDGKKIKEEVKINRQYADYLWELLIDNWSPPHAYLMRRETAQRLHDMQAWNPATTVCQDREYFTVAAAIGAKFFYVPGRYAIYNRLNKSSVSNAAPSIRYTSIEKILTRTQNILIEQNRLQSHELKKYMKVINTQKLLIRTAGFPSIIFYDKFGFADVEWKVVRGIRTNLKIILNLLKSKLFADYKSNP